MAILRKALTVISIDSNVVVASGAHLVTHDQIARVFNGMGKERCKQKTGEIIIGNNVFVGQNAIVMMGVHIAVIALLEQAR